MHRHLTTLLLLLLTLSSAARAQSTDPSNPTPWPAGGARGTGGGVTYYYRINAGAGPMQVHCEARAQSGSSSVSVSFSDAGRHYFASGGAIATTEGGRGDATVNVPQAEPLLVTVTLLGNNAVWSVTLNPQPYVFNLPRINGTDPNGNAWPGLRPNPTPTPAPLRPTTPGGTDPNGNAWPGLRPVGVGAPPTGGPPPMRGPVEPGARPWTGTFSGPWPDRYQAMYFNVTSSGGPLTVEVNISGANANISAFICDPTSMTGSEFPLGGASQANAYTTGPTSGRATYNLQRGVYVLRVIVSHGTQSYTASVTTH
ncbi:MAG: hypothetical protein EB084_11695 [Proteobacteria bacterium]|nr:hypothetical protein [Pseudomonadota bacterium]